MKLLRALFALALVLVFAAPAFAETQNVKVSGSIDAYWFYRSNFDLRDGNDAGSQAAILGGGAPSPFDSTVPGTSHSPSFDNRSEGDDFFRTNTQIEISADLTDNVSTVINLINQRDWNALSDDEFSSNPGDEFDIELDLAYVQMKEIFYSPLTLTIGRQDLWFGRGLIIGSNQTAWDPQGITQADEYSVSTAFDAIRATLDFNPWTLDFVYSKIAENSHNAEDDIDLYIVNVNYKFSEYNAVAELYWVTEEDRGTFPTVSDTGDFGDTRNNDTHTIGGRVQFDPISQITLGGELAYQFGDYRSPFDEFGGISTAQLNPERDRSAWLLDLFASYRWDYEWKPEITVEYLRLSGEDELQFGASGDYGAWNSLYRGKFYTAYADFREFVYATGDPYDQSALTNDQFIQVKGSMKPLQDLLIEASWTYFWTTEDVQVINLDTGADTGLSRDEGLGWEVDLQATYDYTEDVSFSLLTAWFVPGDFFDGPIAVDGGAEVPSDDENALSDDTAFTMVASTKVTF